MAGRGGGRGEHLGCGLTPPPPSYCPPDNGPAAAQHVRGPRAAPAETAWLPAPAELRGPEHLRPGGEAPSREEAPASRGRAAPQPHRRHPGDRPVKLWGPPVPAAPPTPPPPWRWPGRGRTADGLEGGGMIPLTLERLLEGALTSGRSAEGGQAPPEDMCSHCPAPRSAD